MELLFQAAAWPGFPQAAHPLSAGRAVLDAAVGQGCLWPLSARRPLPRAGPKPQPHDPDHLQAAAPAGCCPSILSNSVGIWGRKGI